MGAWHFGSFLLAKVAYLSLLGQSSFYMLSCLLLVKPLYQYSA